MVLYNITNAQFFNHTHFSAVLLRGLYSGFMPGKVKTCERQSRITTHTLYNLNLVCEFCISSIILATSLSIFLRLLTSSRQME